MRKTAIALLLLFSCLVFSLNVSSKVKEGGISFAIDGPSHFDRTNLTLFVWKDGSQLYGTQKNNVLLPYYFTVPYNESGTYELRVIDEKRNYATGNARVAVSGAGEAEAQAAQEQSGTEFAIIIGIVGVAILGYLLLTFLKGKSYNK